MTGSKLPILDTSRPPEQAAELVGDFRPKLLRSSDHDLCAGCGEPIAMRLALEVIDELGKADKAICSVGIGCYTNFTLTMDVDSVQCLHGRAPSVATGVKRMRPDALCFTLQGDGDMVNEGLQEVIHAAARGENITCIMLNNGVFGETGGHMTATTVLGQRTKNSLAGRDAAYHGHPILIADLLAPLGGAAYVARGSVYNANSISSTKRIVKQAFVAQIEKRGFSFVEILTMCPTGWFIPVEAGPQYLNEVLGAVHGTGVLRDGDQLKLTPELLAEARAQAKTTTRIPTR
jgi:2-oxoglutarate ferredoxin oxidoreductase subunit beta